MAPTPRPSGWKGGSEDFGFLRTFDGHTGINLESDEDEAAHSLRSNVKYGFRDIGSCDGTASYCDYADDDDWTGA